MDSIIVLREIDGLKADQKRISTSNLFKKFNHNITLESINKLLSDALNKENDINKKIETKDEKINKLIKYKMCSFGWNFGVSGTRLIVKPNSRYCFVNKIS